MNTLFSTQTWHLLGWTMLHFLWLGMALLIVAAVVRLALRRAGANARYAHSLATLLVLAALPLATATRLVPPPPSAGEGLAEGETLAVRGSPDPALVATEGLSRTSPEVVELNPNYIPPTEPENSPPLDGEGLGEGGIVADVTDTWDRGEAEPLARLAGGSPSTRPQLPFSLHAALESTVPYLPYLWLLGTPTTFALLATGLIGAERMRRQGTPLTDGPVHEACERLRRSLRITRTVALAVCDRALQPVLVGIVRPLILLPPAALTGWSPEQLEMVLLHELAHVRRWDNLVNLAQRVIESLLFFHPAVWIASTWVRRDREECCDAVVVTRTAQPKQYAELLLSLATHQPLAGLALARHPLAARLRRILKLEDEPMLVSRNTIGLLALAVVAIALVVVSGPLRVQGENQSAEEATASSDPPPPSAGEGENSDNSPATDPFAANSPTEPGADNAQPDDTNPLAGIAYPSPREGEIALRAWKELGIKVAPATDAELESTRKHGYRGGLKLIDFDHFPQLEGPVILTEIQSPALSRGIVDFGDLEKVLDAVAQRRPESIVLNGTIGNAKINYSMALPPALGTGPARERYSRIYNVPKDKQSEVKELYKWLQSPNNINVASVPDYDNRLRITATEKEHERIGKVLVDVSPKLPFLSLEDQKIADRAYKLLGVELEPLSTEELAVVKHHGFESGLRVANTHQQAGMLAGDLLVGLHVWPTTDLKAVDAILSRDDLAQLSPMKYYVNRHPLAGTYGSGDPPGPSEPDYETYRVVTGRITVDSNQLRAMQKAAMPSTDSNVPELQAAKNLADTKRKTGMDPFGGQPAKPPMATNDTPTSFNPPALFNPTPAPTYSTTPQPAKPTKQPAPATLPEWPSPPSADSNVYQQQPPAKAPVVVPTPALPFGQPEAVPPDAPGQPYPPTSVLSSTQPVPSQGPVASTPYISDISPAPGAREPVYRYDGKTFQEWRDLWKHELSTERRTEAVKALAAFGRAGYGKEAAEAILDVAGEYDFSYTEVQSAAEDKLMQTVLDVLAPENHRRSLDQYWFPSLVARLEKEPAKLNWLARHLFDRLRTDNEETIEILKSLAQTGPAEVRGDALVALVRSSRLRSGGLQIDDETQGLLTAALESKDKTMVQSALSLLIYPRSPYGGDPSHQQLVFQPELIPLLFHRDKDIQQQARLVLREIQDKDAPQVVESLGNVLEDESRQADHLAAVRALGAVGPAAASAVPQLESLLEDAKDVELRVAAGFAIDGIESGVRGRNALSRQADDSEDEKAQTQYTRLINAEEEIMQLQSRRRFGN